MNTNSLAFLALSNEYCSLLQDAGTYSASEFTERLLRMLPRIYICAFDLKEDVLADMMESRIDQSLTEEEYEYVKSRIGILYGEHDVYLEVFEEDMKYSDTPVASSISENLADIYQALYDFIETARDATDDVVAEAIESVKESFKEYWGSTLCNVLRALNHLWAKSILGESDEM